MINKDRDSEASIPALCPDRRMLGIVKFTHLDGDKQVVEGRPMALLRYSVRVPFMSPSVLSTKVVSMSRRRIPFTETRQRWAFSRQDILS